jgi:hypothetical protein
VNFNVTPTVIFIVYSVRQAGADAVLPVPEPEESCELL